MNEAQANAAKQCLAAAYDGSMHFPAIVGALMAAGFEGYAVDYRRETAIYYLPDGDSLELRLPEDDAPVAARFDGQAVKDAIGAAQREDDGYTYAGFCRQVKAAGCAGYIVSFSGRRVVYIGRTAEMHVEHFPS